MRSLNNRLINAEYKPAQKEYWEGRKSNPDMENQYWHQQIEIFDVGNLQKHTLTEEGISIALVGYVCDEGVRRNRGRIGADKGPKALRERLAKLPIHFESRRVADVGDIVCCDHDMESCQELFSILITRLIEQKVFPIAIGGGHDISYGHFMGIWNVVKSTGKRKIGIINFDAHFDLRPVEGKGNSGTPFNQIISKLKNKNEEIDYFAIGIQQQSNTKELFEIANTKQVDFVLNYDCESSNTELEAIKNKLLQFIAKNDYLYITIDMDGFSSAYAPGVSAPSPLGFTPYFVFKMLLFLFNTNKVISIDLAELNPSLDRDNHTANLAAKLVDFIATNYQFRMTL